MNRKTFKSVVLALSSLMCFCTINAVAQPTAVTRNDTQASIEYFLSEGEYHFNPSVPTPFQVLGYNVGEHYADWNDLSKYMRALDEASARVSIKTFGRTYENREYMQVYITSEENQSRLEEIREEHLKLTNPSLSKGLDISKMPVVVDLMASMHGNESSGANSVLISSYLFAACDNKEIVDLLENTVVIITPGLNPDGFNRFASWVNTTRSENYVADLNSREFTEAWPSSRSNHYWHDCNRDWLSVQHPEGENGVKMFLEWMPNVALDMHEMGGSAQGFYFSPGAANRTHDYIPEKNQQLLKKIADNTAAAFDEKGIFYFSKEGYDDFFIGKGAAYGDLLGCVAILHEQVSSRGMLRPISWGNMSFASTIRNQSVSSISVVRSAYKMKNELLEYQRGFFADQERAIKKDPVKGYRFDTQGDRGRSFHFIQNLQKHGIDVYHEKGKEGSYILPLNQDNYFIIKAMWDNITSYKDSTFYDISTWSFPHAYNIKSAPLNTLSGVLGEKIVENKFPQGGVQGGMSNIAYAFEQNEYYAPYFVSELLKKGCLVRVATEGFEYKYGDYAKKFPSGTIIVPVIYQPVDAKDLFEIVEDLATRSGVDVVSLKSGYMENHDLGSRIFKHVREPKVALVVGRGMSSTESGEIWYLLDKRFNFNHSLVEYSKLSSSSDWSRYNVMIFANGVPSTPLSDEFYAKLHEWVDGGGTLIVTGESHLISNKAKLTSIKGHRGTKVKGVILKSKMGKSSPLSWGYADSYLPLFKMDATTFERGGAAAPVRYLSDPYLSGCISAKNLDRIADSPVVLTQKAGRGSVIFISNDMNFRSYWYGASKLFMNAILYGDML